jgi:hypothetical protein
MGRTLITIPDEDKNWLRAYSHVQKQSIAETIRVAIRELRHRVSKRDKQDILNQTYGLWADRDMDALDYVQKMREEWDERSSNKQ